MRTLRNRAVTNQSGFNLIELMVTVSIMLIAFGAIADFMYEMQKSEHSTNARVDNQEEVRFAMLRIARDIRSSNPVGTYSSVDTYADSIDVALGDSAGTQTYIRWEISGTDLKRETLSALNGTVTGSATILKNIANTGQGLSFLTYYNSSNVELATSGASAVTPGDIVNCSVRIHLELAADPSPGPIFTEEVDAELRNRLPGGAGC
jgi:prepilin-type N-terminal cleavage/methylation domain-containing protein